jgi:hypothetical protein
MSPPEHHAQFLLGLVTGQSDLTLEEVVAVVAKARSVAALRRGVSTNDTAFCRSKCPPF